MNAIESLNAYWAYAAARGAKAKPVFAVISTGEGKHAKGHCHTWSVNRKRVMKQADRIDDKTSIEKIEGPGEHKSQGRLFGEVS